MKPLQQLLIELESFVPAAENSNPTVSSVNVGWHIDHCLLVINQIVNAMERSDPAEYEYRFNFKRWIAFTLNKFPRGVAKAPRQVRPLEAFDADKIPSTIVQTKNSLSLFIRLQPNQFFVHPFFGKLNQKAALKMLTIHTAHHLAIIKDILKQKK
ncbi:DUF1569 domain-containing protein [Sediminibacterium salmoneum]|uniref:DUF1569 domain-containing protein n=1 Tax=Sediminibacterium salmoneum TaxID=426421 RepID=UPI0004794A10|nr:DUF1569 domain-containing protein [Sediminibacterium salmoneum]